MFNKAQKVMIYEIRLTNAIRGNNLLQLALDNLRKFIDYSFAYKTQEINQDYDKELMQHGINALITLTCFLEENYRSEDLNNTMNNKLKKIKQNLNIL